ncbi:MAG: 2-enoyl thioester reductase domain-containing protein [Verrucomicrobiaceae bacterium]|nr:2-enoyl thioester reductase domain-containing protein [Verrucomicrobiaceae bacterium]
MKSRYLVFKQTGDPQQVVEIGERELAPLKPNEVRMKTHFAPINPADLNFIQGNYGRPSHPPAIPGHESAGIVIETGAEVSSLQAGDAVIPLVGAGCWAEHLTAEAQFFAKLPEGTDLAQASMLRVNPVTAWHFLHHFVALEPGDWVLQNAANSGVGRSVIQVAKKLGLRTLNLVRRPELIPELKALGADEMLIDDDNAITAARIILGGKEAKLAGNAVGSDSAIRLMEMLSPEGTLVTYGAMSKRSMKVPNKFLIFKNLILRGLWITRWLEHATPDEWFDVLHPLAEMTHRGSLKTAVDHVYPLERHQEALSRASSDSRGGKVLLKF